MKWLFYLLAAGFWTAAGFLVLIAHRMRPEKTLAAMAETPVEPYELWCFALAVLFTLGGLAAQAAAHDAAAQQRSMDMLALLAARQTDHRPSHAESA